MLLTFLCFLMLSASTSFAAHCKIVQPLEKQSASAENITAGFVFIPGALIPGESYEPLAVAIQAIFPGNIWFGLTYGYFGDLANPLEIDDAVQECFSKAEADDLSTELVFMGGHSLGGVILVSYISNLGDIAMDLTQGLLLFGSYNTGKPEEDPFLPVPAAAIIGTLDAAILSHATLEWKESVYTDDNYPELSGNYPVVLVDRVNHAQVASGVEKSGQQAFFDDIEAELDEAEAHRRYAEAAVAFMVTKLSNILDESVVEIWEILLNERKEFTDAFLNPFIQMSELEETLDKSTSTVICPWMIEGQKMLLGLPDSDLAALVVYSFPKGLLDLVTSQPTLETIGNCSARVEILNHNQYPFNPLEKGNVISANVIKGKFKLETVVAEQGLCLPPGERKQCKDINEAAWNLALRVASEEAVERLNKKGRTLAFIDDDLVSSGPGWIATEGLHFQPVTSTLINVQSVALVTEDDVFPSTFAGMHYCHLLSPYRALEWIYILGVEKI